MQSPPVCWGLGSARGRDWSGIPGGSEGLCLPVREGCLEDHGRWALDHEGFAPGRCPVASWESSVVR